jgi:hypothetical protein
MPFTIEPFQADSVVLLLEGRLTYSHLLFLFAFRQVARFLGYTIPLVRYLDFLVSLGGGLKRLFPCPESLTPCPLPFLCPCSLINSDGPNVYLYTTVLYC